MTEDQRAARRRPRSPGELAGAADRTTETAPIDLDRTAQPSARDRIDAGPDVLTVPEVAKLLRVSRGTVYEMAARGELPRKPMGRLVRFSRTALLRWLDS